MKIKQILFISLFQCHLFSMPENLSVQSGKASIQVSGKEGVIQCSDNSILHWENFSVAEKESLTFLQENSQASVLNRVVGNDISNILGKISANGNIFLINTNGIVIGPDAKIMAASFLASTCDILNEDFLADKRVFQSTKKGWIAHFGEIEATEGDVTLLANQVTSEGRIFAKNGRFSAGAGDIIILEKGKYPKTFSETVDDSNRIILKGSIEAKEIEVVASDSLVIDGDITCSKENSRVYLLAKDEYLYMDGKIEAKGADLFLLGQDIELGPAAYLDASGDKAGNIYIGGDYKGKNPSIPNARTTEVAFGALIRSDGMTRSNGGRVIVWSEEITSFGGEISVRGGHLGGNGGFVEVSGKSLAFEGTADCRAPFGETGTLLLDPKNITIDNAGTALPMQTIPFTYMPSSSFTYTAASVSNQLTMSSVALQANNDITVNASVSSTPSAFFFQLAAGRSVTIASGVNINLDTTAFTSVFNSEAGVAAQRDAGFAQFNCQGTITTNGGLMLIGPGNFNNTAEGNIVLSGATLNSGSGSMTLTGIGSSSGNNQPGINIDNSTVTTSGTALITGTGGGGSGENAGILINNGSMVTATGSGNLVLASNSTGTQNGDGIKIASSGAATLQVANGTLSISGTGSPNATVSGKGVSIFSNANIASADTLLIRAVSSVVTDYAVVNAGTITNTGGKTTIEGSGALGGCNLGGTITTSATNTSLEITGSINGLMPDTTTAILLSGTLSTTNGTSNGATISLWGVGSPTTPVASVGIAGLNNTITSNGGAIILQGFGGGSSATGEGIFFSGTTLTSAGTVSLEAFGNSKGTSTAVVFDDNTNVTVNNGTFSVEANGLNLGGSGFVLQNSWTGSITANGTTPILITAPSLQGSGFLMLGGTMQVQNGDLVVNAISGADLGIGLQNCTIRSTGTGDMIFTASGSNMQVGNGGVVDAQGTGLISANAGKNMIFIATNTNSGLGISNAASQAAILVEAGSNVVFGADSALAALANAGFGEIFVVCDTLFPNSPDFGNGLFFLPNSNTQINTAGNQVRIYTVSPMLNSVNAPINGQAFTSGTFLEDNAFEQYGVYFPNGTYGGQAFNFYYKISRQFFDEQQELGVYNVVVTEAQLSDLLPTIYNNYFNNICEQSGNIVDCQNNPYNNFIRRPYFRR